MRRHSGGRRPYRRFDTPHPLDYKWVRFPNFLPSMRRALRAAGQRGITPELCYPGVIDLEISS